MGDDDLDSTAVRDAKTEQNDPVAEVMRANLRRKLLGVDAAPPKIGRFTILETRGSGAMATVFAAYDPVLDRKVAIKLLNQTGAQGKRDVLREARALAKLTHPNVVAVYDAGEFDDRVYIAMEYVRGVDLRAWLDEHRPTWERIVPIFAAAARGLAAAHRAGVVHSDFKPDNVLVGDDWVRVADFGMARVRAVEPPDRDTAISVERSGGTPLYMAPERIDGEPATAKSDQFAFAVTLHEALFRGLPFSGTTIHAVREAMDRPLVPTPAKRIPNWLHDLVARALNREPSERFANMDEIATALGRSAGAGRTVMVLGGATVAVIAAVGVIAYQSGARTDPCAGGHERASAVYSEATGARIRTAFERTGAPFSASALAHVDASLTEYRDRWAQHHRAACEATRIRGDQSDSTYDLRMRCLDRRLDELGALVEVLAAVTLPAEVAAAHHAVARLTALSRCEASAALTNEYAAPPTELADTVARTRTDIDTGWALYNTGSYAAAMRTANTTFESARSMGFEPVLAEALHLRGTVQARTGSASDAEATLHGAELAAARSGHTRLSADITIRLLRTAMFQGELSQVEQLAVFARAAALRAGTDEHEVDGIVGEALLQQGRAPEAIVALELALSTETRPHRAAILTTTLASARLANAQVDAAVAGYERALEMAIDQFGDGHPSAAFFLDRQGRGLRAAGRPHAARPILLRALDLRTSTLGPRDRAVATTLADLGQTERALGEFDEARAHLRQALEIRREVYGTDHPRTAAVLQWLADVEGDAGDRFAALELYQRALAIREARTPHHPQVGELKARIAALRTDDDASIVPE